jgi:hypothetical protein
MYAIASLFNPLASQATQSFWETLETNCGLSGVKTTPYPHFSWLGTENYSWKPVRERLQILSAGIPPFKVQTAGLGIFTGANPILYITLVKTPQLSSIHAKIWSEVFPFLLSPNLYYSPDHWIPHITLAYGDLTIKNLPCAIEGIIDQPLDFGIEITSIEALFHTQDEIGITEVFPLLGQIQGPK